MSNEITVSTTIKLVDAVGYSYDRRISGQQFDQTALGASGGIQEIGFGAHQALVVTNLTDEGWAIFRNLDATNFVELGIDVGAVFKPFIRLEPGEPALFRLSPDAVATPFAQADTGNVLLEYMILEN